MTAVKELSAERLDQARTFSVHMLKAIRILRGHGAHNETFLRAVEALNAEATRLSTDVGGEVDFRFEDDLLFVNGTFVAPVKNQLDNLGALTPALLESDVGGFTLMPGRSDRAISAWLLAVGPAIRDEAEVELRWMVLQEAEGLGIQSHRYQSLGARPLDVVDIGAPDFAVRVLARAIVAFRNTQSDLQKKEPSRLEGVSAVIRDLVDLALRFPERLELTLGQARQRGNDEPWHAAMVAARSILLGRQLGLTPNQLLDLGRAALLSRIGYSALPQLAVSASAEVRSRRHLAAADRALVLLGIRLDRILTLATVVATEHAPETGIPSDAIDPRSRIVRVAHAYEKNRDLDALKAGSPKTYASELVACLTP